MVIEQTILECVCQYEVVEKQASSVYNSKKDKFKLFMQHIPRFWVNQPLFLGQQVLLDPKQVHHLRHVLRFQEGEMIYLFNGQDGEWAAEILAIKGQDQGIVLQQHRSQVTLSKIGLAFPSIRKERLHFMIEKAVELGVTDLQPLTMAHSQHRWVENKKIEQYIIDAAQQSNRLCLPAFHPVKTLQEWLTGHTKDQVLWYGHEGGAGQSLAQARLNGGADIVLVGPEGGFAPHEFQWLAGHLHAQAVNLGNLILRTETAALVLLGECLATQEAHNHKGPKTF